MPRISKPTSAGTSAVATNSPNPDTALRPYQVEGIAFLRRAERAYLGDEPGLGKSRQAIEASVGKTLVVAPAMVLAGGTWDDEIKRWADDSGRFTQVAYTSIPQRRPRMIINDQTGQRTPKLTKTGQQIYESTDKPRPDLRGPWDTIILDEAHMIKGRSTHWTRAIEIISRRGNPRIYLLSGTPIPNWVHESFTAARLLHPDDAHPGRPLGSYWNWVKRWFDVSQARHGGQFSKQINGPLRCTPECAQLPPTRPCQHYFEIFQEVFGDRYLMRLRDAVLTDLPPLTEQRIECPMVPKQRKAYNDLKKQFVTVLADGTELIAWTPGALNVKLQRVCAGLQTLTDGQVEGSGKLDRLAYDLSGRSRPTLVFAHFQASVEAAHRVAQSVGARSAFVHGGMTKKTAADRIAAFKTGRLDVLCGSLETMSEGHTLTQADMAIMLEKSYKPSRNDQAIRRIHRLGQTRPVSVLDYVTPGSLDANIRRLLATKTDQQIRFLSCRDFAELL